MRAPDFDEAFAGTAVDPSRWLQTYLPHWSADPDATRPKADVADGRLRLTVAADQPEWCPEFDPGVRVSNLQTSHISGPVGGGAGQHRFRDGLVVRSAVPEARLFLMRRGRLEMQARAALAPGNLAGLWMIGVEDRPERSGEICLFEVFGDQVARDRAVIGCGIKPIADPRLTPEFDARWRSVDVAEWHEYALDWTPDGIVFTLDGNEMHRCRQSPDYPMQLMLNLYALPDRGASDGWFEVDRIRAWSAEREERRP